MLATATLFDDVVPPPAMPLVPDNLKAGQYFTPEWAAVELVERFFSDLTGSDLVLEPSCGPGAFLKAIPSDVPAIGVELDPELVKIARENTQREVLWGDFRNVPLPGHITQVIGNPPFRVRLIEQFITRFKSLHELQRVGLLLPAYAFQTHSRVTKWMDYWSIRAEIVPRRLFPRLRLPLVFVVFSRGASREVVGFCLFRQAVEFDHMSEQAKELLTNGRPGKGVWYALVDEVLTDCGGEARLEQIYAACAGRRPTPNQWWKEKVRQTLQRHFVSVERGRWSNVKPN